MFLYSFNTNIYHFWSMMYRKYALIPANRRIHLPVCQRQVLVDSIMTNKTAILNEKCTSGSGLNQVGIMMVFLKEKFEKFIKNK